MQHTMKLNQNAFDRMKNGIKKREYRVNDEKRQKIRVGDTIEFQKLPYLTEKILMDVEKIELYNTLEDAIRAHFKDDFENRHSNIKNAIDSFYKNGYCTKEEIEKYGMIILRIKKHRTTHPNSTDHFI